MNAVKEKAAQAAFFVFKVKAQGAYAFHKDAKAPSVAAQRGRLRTSSLRCARSRANALRCSKTLPAFLSQARDALLQAYAPIALRLWVVCKPRFQRLCSSLTVSL
jgi:hypothetical protein